MSDDYQPPPEQPTNLREVLDRFAELEQALRNVLATLSLYADRLDALEREQ